VPHQARVVLIGKAQEQRSACKGRRDDQGGKVWFSYRRCSVRVTQYSFYLHDEDFGLACSKVRSYLLFEVQVCLHGHAWAKEQLRREAIAFEPLENGVADCADPARLHALGHQLRGARSHALFDRWVEQLPWPRSPAARAAGSGHRLSVWQLEVSRTQVFVDPAQGRVLVEGIIREHLDLGRPDRVPLIFGRVVTKRTPGECATQVVQHGVVPTIRVHYQHSVLKQDCKDGCALRTELMSNNPADFRVRALLAAEQEHLVLVYTPAYDPDANRIEPRPNQYRDTGRHMQEDWENYGGAPRPSPGGSDVAGGAALPAAGGAALGRGVARREPAVRPCCLVPAAHRVFGGCTGGEESQGARDAYRPDT
jgi:hypothetical protein